MGIKKTFRGDRYGHYYNFGDSFMKIYITITFTLCMYVFLKFYTLLKILILIFYHVVLLLVTIRGLWYLIISRLPFSYHLNGYYSFYIFCCRMYFLVGSSVFIDGWLAVSCDFGVLMRGSEIELLLCISSQIY